MLGGRRRRRRCSMSPVALFTTGATIPTAETGQRTTARAEQTPELPEPAGRGQRSRKGSRDGERASRHPSRDSTRQIDHRIGGGHWRETGVTGRLKSGPLLPNNTPCYIGGAGAAANGRQDIGAHWRSIGALVAEVQRGTPQRCTLRDRLKPRVKRAIRSPASSWTFNSSVKRLDQ